MVHGSGQATGKIILMGEHSVVYGEPAIAFPFAGTKVVAQISDYPQNWVQSGYYTGPLVAAPKQLHNLKKLLKKLQADFHSESFMVTIESTIPSERGMGSSAAVAVAITRAFFDWQEVELTDEQLLAYVTFSEKIAHGNPSGIDAAATSGNEPIYFVRDEPFASFPLNIDAYLLVADTGIKGQTREAVKSVAHLMEQNKKEVQSNLQALGALTEKAKDAIISNDTLLLGNVMTQAHLILRELTVSNQALDRYVALALNHGALGAKLTGGGRGGCLIVLTEDRMTAEKISQLLETNGVKATWIQGLGAYQYV